LDDNGHNNKLKNLYYGTRKENWADCVRNGGARLGSKNHATILTAQAVREIRKSKEPHAVLATRYGISCSHVNGLKCGRGWRWVK
jgi:hypothetical protein